MTENGKKSVFVFDGDETLYLSSWQYDEAYLKFFLYLHEIFPTMVPSLHPLYRKFFEEFEQNNAKHYGVRKERVPESMLNTYEAVCKYIQSEFGMNPRRREYEEKIREIGKMPFAYQRVKWLPDAQETLHHLLFKGHKLCLLSNYDSTVFPGKESFLKVRQFFKPENIYTTEFGKTKEDFIKVSGWSEDGKDEFEKWYTVGNSTSDMRPALEISAKWHGLYVRRTSTSPFFENATSDFVPPTMEHPRVVNMTRIKEILNHI